MNIVYSSSDNYSMCTGISLYSLYLHNRDIDDMDVTILSTDISEQNRSNLISIAKEFNRNLKILDAKEDFIRESERLHLPLMRGAYNTYSRVMLNTWFSNLDKIMVIDSDTMVCDNLVDVWNINIDGFYLAAAPELAMYTPYNHLEDPDIIRKAEMYYNMGICIVNLKKWREDDIDTLIYNNVQKEANPFKIADQSIINKYLMGSIKRLPLRYNFYSPVHNVSYKAIKNVFSSREVFSEEEIKSASLNPAIIHYFGHSFERPWFKHSVALRDKEYYEIKKKTPWKEVPLQKWRSSGGAFFKVYDVMCYILLKIHLYNLCLKFRYKNGQQLKNFLGKSRK